MKKHLNNLWILWLLFLGLFSLMALADNGPLPGSRTDSAFSRELPQRYAPDLSHPGIGFGVAP